MNELASYLEEFGNRLKFVNNKFHRSG